MRIRVSKPNNDKADINNHGISRIQILLVALIVAGVGTAVLLVSLAASNFISVQPETAVLSNGATSVTDSRASGGKALRFGTPSTPPNPPPSGGSWNGWDPNSTSIPSVMSAWPWSNNTGLWDSATMNSLQTISGGYTTTANNQVIDLKKITGTLVVKHSGVIVKRSWVTKIDNQSGSPVVVIYSDIGQNDPGNATNNSGTRGTVQIYRSNIFGVLDGVMTSPGKGTFIIQDCFFHDLDYADDSSQKAGNTHNDAVQINTTGVNMTMRHNTFWMWMINNRTSHETATRSSGPHWTNNGDPIASTGVKGVSPYLNSAFIVGSGAASGTDFNPTLTIDNNLFRGDVYTYLNIQTGTVKVTNNLFATDEGDPSRRPNVIAGRQNVGTWSGNKDYKTGATL